MSDILTGSTPRGNAAGPISDHPDQLAPPEIFALMYRAIQDRDFRTATRYRRLLNRRGYVVIPRETAFSTAPRAGGSR